MSPIGLREKSILTLEKNNSQIISGDVKIAPVSVGTPKMGGNSEGNNSPNSPTFNFGGFNIEAKDEDKLKI